MSSVSATLLGRTVGPYRVDSVLGEGGMGTVFRVAHTGLGNKPYAMKVMHELGGPGSGLYERFQREAALGAKLRHPHIAEIHHFDVTSDGHPYLVMELLEGENLAQRLGRGQLPLSTVASILKEVSGALTVVHDAGVVHRDLKPANIFLCRRSNRDDFVKVMDFGISKVLEEQLTRSGDVFGTSAYMSPEQAGGHIDQIDRRTDVFALAAIAWELLTHQRAFAADTETNTMIRVMSYEPPLVHEIRSEINPAVSNAIKAALCKTRDQRTGTTAEMVDTILEHLDAKPPQPQPQPEAKKKTLFAAAVPMPVTRAAAAAKSPTPAGQPAMGAAQPTVAASPQAKAQQQPPPMAAQPQAPAGAPQQAALGTQPQPPMGTRPQSPQAQPPAAQAQPAAPQHYPAPQHHPAPPMGAQQAPHPSPVPQMGAAQPPANQPMAHVPQQPVGAPGPGAQPGQVPVARTAGGGNTRVILIAAIALVVVVGTILIIYFATR